MALGSIWYIWFCLTLSLPQWKWSLVSLILRPTLVTWSFFPLCTVSLNMTHHSCKVHLKTLQLHSAVTWQHVCMFFLWFVSSSYFAKPDLKMTFSSSTGRLFISQLSSEGGCEGSLVQFSSRRSPIWEENIETFVEKYLLFTSYSLIFTSVVIEGALWGSSVKYWIEIRILY